MIDYLALQNNTENPTFIAILFTILLSFLLSSVLAITYDKTTKQLNSSVEYLQSLVLVSMVAAMVMQAIGDSLARGLGILGALAIIRFRTNLKGIRNIVFVFASLAIGISCGVFGFVIGITGTIGFCLVAFILKFSTLQQSENMRGILKFDLPQSSTELEKIEKILSHFCTKFLQVRYSIDVPKVANIQTSTLHPPPPQERYISYEYHLTLKDKQQGALLDSALMNVTTLQSLKLNFVQFQETI